MCRAGGRRCDAAENRSISSGKRNLRRNKARLSKELSAGNLPEAHKAATRAVQATQRLAEKARHGHTVIVGGAKGAYGGSHEAPTNDGYSQPLTGAGGDDWVFPADFNENPDWYAGETEETLKQIRAVQEGAKQVTIYRAVPVGERVISDGDWVGLSREYAEHHAIRESDEELEYEVIAATVPASHVFSDGNSLEEWGYDSRSREVADFWIEYDPDSPPRTEVAGFTGDKPSEPLRFSYMRNPVSLSENQAAGHYFGQDIEPAGRYMSQRYGDFTPDGWEAGEVDFRKPLYILGGGNYDEPDNWKQRLHAHYGVAGAELSEALRADGYDAIVTYDERYGIGEVVDLGS